jgi:hypothetical protein
MLLVVMATGEAEPMEGERHRLTDNDRRVDLSCLFQSMLKCRHQMRGPIGGRAAEKANHRQRRLLSARGMWPRRRAAEHTKEIAPPHVSTPAS